MNCFVIMPFAKEFDDVYATIKTNVEAVVSSRGGRCFRLDETRPAGPITDRLLREIQAATFCVADVTGNIPNVMWEVGYAMALGKPIIIITQKISELPFDIRDLQSLEYDRSQVSRTLGEPLRKVVLDTIRVLDIGNPSSDVLKERDILVGTLLAEIKDLKGMVENIVKVWEPSSAKVEISSDDLSMFEGAWINTENGSHLYAKVINDELIVPYCYSGNDVLTSVFYDWRRAGDYWFAKFSWLDKTISGFAFLKQDKLDSLSGAWWSDDEFESRQDAPPPLDGIPVHIERRRDLEFPKWALRFFEKVQKEGLANIIGIEQK